MNSNTFTIELIWNEEKVSVKKIDREKFMRLMESIKDTFVTNNEISKKFVEIIPKVEKIIIDNDRNRDLDVPFVTCKFFGEEKHIRIPRSHRVIWEILNECVS